MARRNEHECAHCAEDFELSHRVIGNDWKVYCSQTCAQAGEVFSSMEARQWMNYVRDRRADELETEFSPVQLLTACGQFRPVHSRS